MTDIAVEKASYQTPTRSWLLFEADGLQGPVPRAQAAIDFSTFDDDVYPDGFLPSGMGLAWSGDGKSVVAIGTTGAGAAAGLLYNATEVPGDNRKVVVAIVDAFAVVSLSRLPEGSGVTGGSQFPLIKFRA